MPPCGGVPYSSASTKKPNRALASSGSMLSSEKMRLCMAASWIRTLPPPTSLPFSTRS